MADIFLQIYVNRTMAYIITNTTEVTITEIRELFIKIAKKLVHLERGLGVNDLIKIMELYAPGHTGMSFSYV